MRKSGDQPWRLRRRAKPPRATMLKSGTEGSGTCWMTKPVIEPRLSPARGGAVMVRVVAVCTPLSQ